MLIPQYMEDVLKVGSSDLDFYFMISSQEFLQSFLPEELFRRNQLDPKYSVTVFAFNLGVDPVVLSRFLAGRKSLSSRTRLKIVKSLTQDSEQKKCFIRAVACADNLLLCDLSISTSPGFSK